MVELPLPLFEKEIGEIFLFAIGSIVPEDNRSATKKTAHTQPNPP